MTGEQFEHASRAAPALGTSSAVNESTGGA